MPIFSSSCSFSSLRAPLARRAALTLLQLYLGITYHIQALNARKNGFGAIIAMAGMAAHLAGAIAANTTIPVIGIPCKSGPLAGMDALLATVQMPTGIPVATVAIDGGGNAALLAAQIIAVEDAQLAEKLDAKRRADAAKVLAKNDALAL